MDKKESNTSKPTAMYIHGLASGANSNTGKEMQKSFPNYNWLLPEVNEVLTEAIDTINQWIEKYKPEVIIGTSYGGLMTMYADAPNSVKIVCNPAVNAEVSFVEKIGLGEHEYFLQRLDGAKTFVIDEAICQGIADYKASHNPIAGVQNHAIFAANDEVIGKDATLTNAAFAYDNGYKIHIDAKGMHRNTPSTLDIISKIIAEL